MKINPGLVTLRSTFTLLSLSIAAAVSADTDAPRKVVSSALEEVFVTAQKREQSINEIGISMSVMSGDTMSALGMQTSSDVVAAIPNVEHTAIFGPGTNPNYSIRGVTQNDFNDATESPIATYMDGVYFVTTGVGSFPIYDLARVEVLRGPQGTLFGRNSTGGVMHFISNDPDDILAGEIKVGFGEYDTRRSSGFINVPAGDRFQVRLAGSMDKNDGWIENITGNQPDAGENDSSSVRLNVGFDATDTIRDVLKVSYSEAKGHTTGIWRDSTVQDPVTGLISTLPEGTPDQFGNDPVQKFTKADNGGLRELKMARSVTAINTLNWEASETTSITSVTGYNEYSRDVVEDCDGIQPFVCATHYDNNSHQFSQELRAYIDLGDQQYTIGGYYLEQTQNISQIAPLFVEYGNAIGLPGGLLYDVDAHQDLKGYAFFANGEFALGDDWKLIAGMRYSYDEKTMDQRFLQWSSPNPTDPVSEQWKGYEDTTEVATGGLLSADYLNDSTGGNSFDKESWNAKLELDYNVSYDVLVYGTISRGTKAPGYNHGIVPPGLAVEDYYYDEEKLTAYELGVKAALFENSAQLNAAVFYYDYKDYHTLSFFNVNSYLSNSDAEIYGAEFDFTSRPLEGLTLNLNAGLIDSTLYDAPTGTGYVRDADMPIAPSYTVSASINYEFDLGGEILGLQLDGRTRDDFYNDPANNPASKVDGYHVLNARIYLADMDSKWIASLQVKNLTDEEYETSTFLLHGLGGYRYGFNGQPRWVTADLTYRF